MRWSIAWLGVLLAAPWSLHGEPVRVNVAPRAPLGQRTLLKVTAKSPDGKEAPTVREVLCGPIEPCDVELLVPGVGWFVDVSAPKIWSRGAVTADPATSKAVLDIWPVVTIRGLAEFPSKTSGSELTVRFRIGGDSPENDVAADEEVRCPISDGKWSCEIPVGASDLALRVRGHVTVWRRMPVPDPSGTIDLGKLVFGPGASVVGRVISAERDPLKPATCRVSLVPRSAPGAHEKKAPDVTLSSGVDERGFFHIDFAPPGTFDVVAQQPGFVSARQQVTVLEGVEASLRKPLVLSRPRRDEVFVTPPQDPDGRPWRVALVQVRDDGRIEDFRGESAASLAGAWLFEGAPVNGRFKVLVKTAAGQGWFVDEEPFTVGGDPSKRFVEVGVERVRGTVFLGTSPLQGRIAFGAGTSLVTVPLLSDAEGRFEGALPRLGKWSVSVDGEAPGVQRRLDVDVRRASGGEGEVEIRLPDRSLTGEIVLDGGELAPRAVLSVRSPGGGEWTSKRVEGGTFRVDGLSPGRYVLSAEAAGEFSDDVEASVLEDGDAEPLRIQLRKKGLVRIRVVSPGGVGVAGAQVWFLPATWSRSTEGAWAKVTDAEGRVSATVRASAAEKCVAVFGGGFAARLVSVPVAAEEQTVALSPASATLVLEYAPPSSAGFPMLYHGGCSVPPAFFLQKASEDARTIRSVEPGSYRLCLLSRAPAGEAGGDVPRALRCVDADAPAFGASRLSVLDPGSK